MRNHLFLLSCCLLCFGCAQKNIIDTEPPAEHQNWASERLERLTAPQSWSSLIGLHWLSEGRQTMGADDHMDIIIKTGPSSLGVWSRVGDTITFYPDSTIKVYLDQQRFTGGTIALNTDLLTAESLMWTIIKRDTMIGVRMWDTLHPARQSIAGIPAFPYQPDWKMEVAVTTPVSPREVMLDNVLGMSISFAVQGVIDFEVDGERVELIAIDGGPDQLFIIFEDLTTSSETYGGGRYLYCARPDSHGLTLLDFNKAINPPCAFTGYATCLLPPKQNFIPIHVRAGEMAPGEHY